MRFMPGAAGSWSLGARGLRSAPQALYLGLLTELVMMSLVFGKIASVNQNPSYPTQFPKYLRCYRCLLETEELGCLLGSDICLVPLLGSSCITLHIKNSSGSDIMVSDCRSKEQMSDCSYTHTSPVSGFWMFSQCCFLNFCNDPQKRSVYLS
ncbi:lymphocyte antigen 6 complex locus protein G5c [Tupaia chinensis]|uniref:Lymphocyte antigen 6 complex locus protein G5c n=1 Tax=Tupaia chinensis TaxID=246437 RepID=L9KGJ1_TUPCH|nr:lymphocyte antigen 6 complex locus protein G5c [Tupaia chinensis]ELW61856.1 Lymphocyte antigen 6 complex locus protein G5c [Tupaia chinensis]